MRAKLSRPAVVLPGIEGSPIFRARCGREDDGMRRTVLIVDDHEAFRASARALLDAEGFDVIGEAI